MIIEQTDNFRSRNKRSILATGMSENGRVQTGLKLGWLLGIFRTHPAKDALRGSVHLGWMRRSAPRADSNHLGLYPSWAKKLAHSLGVKRGMASRMAAHRSSTVRAAALRRMALSLAKASSMGFRSGEYGGR